MSKPTFDPHPIQQVETRWSEYDPEDLVHLILASLERGSLGKHLLKVLEKELSNFLVPSKRECWRITKGTKRRSRGWYKRFPQYGCVVAGMGRFVTTILADNFELYGVDVDLWQADLAAESVPEKGFKLGEN
jgi:hypothetical protein